MTRTGFALFLIIGGGTLNLCAQEAARPTVDLTTTPIEQSRPASTPSVTPAPPPDLPNLPELSQLDEVFKQSSLGKTADEFRMRIEWRRLRNRLANDPEVVAAKKASDAARTDLEKRERLRDYYRIYYARMQVLADRPELKAALQEMKEDHLKLTAQNRVRPSPSPSASSQPTAAAAEPSPSAPSESPTAGTPTEENQPSP